MFYLKSESWGPYLSICKCILRRLWCCLGFFQMLRLFFRFLFFLSGRMWILFQVPDQAQSGLNKISLGHLPQWLVWELPPGQWWWNKVFVFSLRKPAIMNLWASCSLRLNWSYAILDFSVILCCSCRSSFLFFHSTNSGDLLSNWTLNQIFISLFPRPDSFNHSWISSNVLSSISPFFVFSP